MNYVPIIPILIAQSLEVTLEGQSQPFV